MTERKPPKSGWWRKIKRACQLAGAIFGLAFCLSLALVGAALGFVSVAPGASPDVFGVGVTALFARIGAGLGALVTLGCASRDISDYARSLRAWFRQ